MAKLIHILAASVGGGLVLGASIRLGEAIGTSARKRERSPALAHRLNRLEQKIAKSPAPSQDWQAVFAGVTARMDRQQSEMQALRQQVSGAMLPKATADNPAKDLRQQVSEEVDRRLAALEEKLHLSMERANRETAGAMVSSIERRLAPQIERLEQEIGDQAAAVAALRDCSLQSERSIQRLLTVMERTLAPKARTEDGTSQDSGAETARQELPKLSVVR